MRFVHYVNTLISWLPRQPIFMPWNMKRIPDSQGRKAATGSATARGAYKRYTHTLSISHRTDY